MKIRHPRTAALAAAITIALPLSAPAQGDNEALSQQIQALQRQLDALQAQVAAQQEKSTALQDRVAKVSKQQSAVTQSESVVHLAGYGSVGYTDNKDTKGRFNQVQFSPIFHYQYKDLMMLESELEISNTADGETKTELEYLSLDLFLNDYTTLVAGKFLSPIGQFRQNLHPGWINKLPSAPPGFGHDGAAPISETGAQLRGGFPLADMRANYALYVGNGPELEAVTEGSDVELEGIIAEGRTADSDGSKVWGARLGLLPMPGLEIGLSAATGKAAVTLLDGTSIGGQSKRDYDVLGMDFSWRWGALRTRGEFVQSKVGADTSGGATASSAAKWRSWYLQASQRLGQSKFEGVLRYTDFDSPHAAEDQRQIALGVNYLFAPNVIAKAAYEFNDGQSNSETNADSLLLQLSYGF